MVRTAVKTLTLNVYGIRLPAVQRFVASRPASAYFTQLAAYIAEQCQVREAAEAGGGHSAVPWQVLHTAHSVQLSSVRCVPPAFGAYHSRRPLANGAVEGREGGARRS